MTKKKFGPITRPECTYRKIELSDLHFEILNHGDGVLVVVVAAAVVVAETTGLWAFLLSLPAVAAVALAVGHAPVAVVHELPDSLQPLAIAGQFVH